MASNATQRAQDGWAHPKAAAPGALAVVQMFVNSDDLEEGTDEYATPAGVTRWLRSAGLLGARETADERDRRAAVDLRSALRTLLLENHDATSSDRAARAVLERAGRAAGLEVRLAAPAGAQLVPTATGVPRALGVVVAAVYEAMRDGTWPRMKACRNDECLWAFYDHSRNRSGAWCQMETCGTQAKMRAYRQRQTR
jgi:predicted RNA-binding Zn ribbon-like protein